MAQKFRLLHIDWLADPITRLKSNWELMAHYQNKFWCQETSNPLIRRDAKADSGGME